MAFFDIVAEMVATESSNNVESSNDKTDNWDAGDYQKAAAFVPQLARKVVEWLDVRPDDRVLDVGCGDGVLTQQIVEKLTEGSVLGIDSSGKMIEAAKSMENMKETPKEKLRYAVVDATTLLDVVEKNEREEESKDEDEGGVEDDELGLRNLREGVYTKIFSNAALHWILRAPETRTSVLEACYKLLKPGGLFVFEMGGAGNVAELRTALLSSTARRVGMDAARSVDPWYFPSETWMRSTLEEIGFVIEKIETEYRPTKAESGDLGGLEGWVRLMGRCFLDIVVKEGGDEEEMVKEVCETLETVCGREDRSSWMGYVRLRVKAVKPE